MQKTWVQNWTDLWYGDIAIASLNQLGSLAGGHSWY